MDRGSPDGRAYFQLPAELPHAFAHTKQADSYGGVFLANSESLGRNTASVINDFQVNLAVLDIKSDNGGGTARVTVNVGEGFLNHAKYGDLEFNRKALQCRGQVEFDVDTASLREAVDKPTNGGQKSDLVEH